LVIATVAGTALFHEIPDLLSWLGIAMILLSCVLAVPSTKRAPA
jgi:drug/metabolite transporter (DMT)-like permease